MRESCAVIGRPGRATRTVIGPDLPAPGAASCLPVQSPFWGRAGEARKIQGVCKEFQGAVKVTPGESAGDRFVLQLL